jgi:Xaa-Pro aminopeptidase
MKIKEFKQSLKKRNIDYFLLPNCDEFFSEYLPEDKKRIQYLTGFTGSNAVIVFGEEKSYFFTDGRYITQAKNQLNLDEFEIINMADKSLLSWLEENLKSKKIALDAKLHSVKFIEALQRIAPNLILLDSNPVDEIIKNPSCQIKSRAFFLDEKLTGLNYQDKIKQTLHGFESDAMIITKPEDLCWLLNIRASDIEFNPLLLTYAILFKNGTIDLFLDEERLLEANLSKLENINLIQENCFDLRVSFLKKQIKKIQIDKNSTNYWLYSLLKKNDFEIIFKNCPIENLKTIKNKTEIAGAIKAHEADGAALRKFLIWLKNTPEIDEIKAEEKLLEFKKENKNFLYPSFASISGFASNSAIIHYRATKKTNKKFDQNSLYLIDSGSQYYGDFMGTTDVTRTIAIGKPTAEMIDNFTRVLKGHIAIARAKFPKGTTGAQLDALARFHLWQKGLDYDHGTGHGVGAFLSVHEGPCGISKRALAELKEGMIISNEPGFYKEGEYGIRIENLMLVEKFDEKFLCFKTLTLAPIDLDLVDFKMLTFVEKKWLEEYHSNF